MKTIQITPGNALTAYKNTDKAGKTLLENLIGKDFFNQKITDRVKSYQDACEVLGVAPTPPTGDGAADAFICLSTIARALNEGWKPDWDDEDETKYVPYFEKKRSGFVFNCVFCNCTLTCVGSRLCFRSEELAKYAATQFADLYNAFLTL